MAGSSQSLRNFQSKTLNWRDRSHDPLPFFPMREEERSPRGGHSKTVQSSYTWVVWTPQSKLRSLRRWKLRTTESYSHIPWPRRSPPLPRSRLAPRESFIPKGKPARREGAGGRERTNMPHTAWTPTCGSVSTSSSPCLLFFRRNPKKISRIWDLMGWNLSTGRARSQA